MQGSAALMPKHWRQQHLLPQGVSAVDGASLGLASPSAHGAVCCVSLEGVEVFLALWGGAGVPPRLGAKLPAPEGLWL